MVRGKLVALVNGQCGVIRERVQLLDVIAQERGPENRRTFRWLRSTHEKEPVQPQREGTL